MNAEYERVRVLLPKLTKPQFEFFSRVCVGDDRFANPKTVSVLVRHGLIEQYRERRSGAFPVTIHRYRHTSLAVHMAWAEYCAELPTDGVVQ